MNLTKKQQIQVSLIALCIIIFFWQLYKLFSSPAVEMPPTVPQKMVNKDRELAYPIAKSGPAAKTAAPVAALEGPGVEYTRLSSELQIIQMQRAIAESYEAIAVAKRNTAKALADTAQIMGSNVAIPGSVNMEGPHLNNEYELIYTGQEGGQWTATLKKNNQTFDIVPNTVLGNMKVVSIDDNGVTVMQGTDRKMITFSGIVPVDEPTEETSLAQNLPKPAAPVIKLPVASEVNHSSTHPQSQIAISSVPVKATTVENRAQPAATITANPVLTQPVTSGVTSAPPAALPALPPGATLPNKAPPSTHAIKPTEPKLASLATGSSTPIPNLTVNDKQDLQKPIENKPAATVQDSKLATLNPAHYTIQIMADNDDAALSRFVKAHKLSDKAIIVKTKRNGKAWYILLYGDYPNSVTANTVMNQLNDNLSEWDPFVRKIGSIQTDTSTAK